MEPLDALNQIAFRLERNGADTFKVQAFRKAARAIKEMPDKDLESLARSGRLQSIDGVGKSTAQVIAEALDGKVPAYLTKIDEDLTKDDLVVEGAAAELLGEALLVEPVRDREAGAVVGQDEVLATQVASRLGHLEDGAAAVGPVGVGMAVTAQRCAHVGMHWWCRLGSSAAR